MFELGDPNPARRQINAQRRWCRKIKVWRHRSRTRRKVNARRRRRRRIDAWRGRRRANRWSAVHPETARPVGHPGNVIVNPPPLAVLRRAVALSPDRSGLSRFLRLWFTYLFTRPQYLFAHAPGVRFTVQVGGAVAFVVTLAAFFMDIEVRRDEAITGAWSLISATREKNVGNAGVGSALELLAGQDVALTDIQMPGANLRGVELENAKLGRANFGMECVNPVLQRKSPQDADAEWHELMRENDAFADLQLDEKSCESQPTDLLGSSFAGSNLVHSSFTGATLIGADFSSSCLFAADLRGADLYKADFTDAILMHARMQGTVLSGNDFSGADLRYVSFDAAVCISEKNGKEVLEVCTRGQLEELVDKADQTCGITDSQGNGLGEECKKEDSAELPCTEEHGFIIPEVFVEDDA